MQIYSPTLGGTRFLMFFIEDKREDVIILHLSQHQCSGKKPDLLSKQKRSYMFTI